jgi:N-acetylglutamate synthase-like GNAT family acetyltransferase
MITARLATTDDIPVLVELYRELEKEMLDLHAMWPLADGLPEPVEEAFESELADDDSLVILGSVSGYPFGFLLARVESILPQAEGELIGSIRIVFVELEARQVSVGEVMRDLAMQKLRERGISKFDAHVLPGHRLAKNFFEAGGFSARSIVMHHDDNRE